MVLGWGYKIGVNSTISIFNCKELLICYASINWEPVESFISELLKLDARMINISIVG